MGKKILQTILKLLLPITAFARHFIMQKTQVNAKNYKFFITDERQIWDKHNLVLKIKPC
jgi:hypothetical protein